VPTTVDAFHDDTQGSHRCEYACDFLRAMGPLLPPAFPFHTDTQVRCIRAKTIAQQQAWGTTRFCIGATHNVGFCSETRLWSGARETAFLPSVQTPVLFGNRAGDPPPNCVQARKEPPWKDPSW